MDWDLGPPSAYTRDVGCKVRGPSVGTSERALVHDKEGRS